VLRNPSYAYVSQLQISHVQFAELRAWLPALAGLLQLSRLELAAAPDLGDLLQLEALARALPGLKDLVLARCPLEASPLARPYAAARFRHLVSLNGEMVLEPERRAARAMFAGVAAARAAAAKQAGQQAARRALRLGEQAGGGGGGGRGPSLSRSASPVTGMAAGGPGASQQAQERWRAARAVAELQLDGLLAQVQAVQAQVRQFESAWEEVVEELVWEGWQGLYDLPQAC
jgi:hypothetical protein